MSHTPGPWTWGDNPNERHHNESTSRGALLGPNHDVVLDGCPSCEVLSCDDRDARLITAAPDLLAALKAADEELVLGYLSPLRAQIDAAIAKAEGR